MLNSHENKYVDALKTHFGLISKLIISFVIMHIITILCKFIICNKTVFALGNEGKTCRGFFHQV